uniref:Tectonic-1 isoform X2 n=1 Tax=Geotrypetes seraphini TaxID=260995 RepID=A0A6P8S3H6_GEOSA|nr:tectonic-1 isoform X2 [Geotrypetes seraphini]
MTRRQGALPQALLFPGCPAIARRWRLPGLPHAAVPMAVQRPGAFYPGLFALAWLLATTPFTPQAGPSPHTLVEGNNGTPLVPSRPPVAPSTVPFPSDSRRDQTPGSSSRAVPLPSPVTDVAKLCVCNLLVAQCDVNCCCDPDCSTEDFSVFSTCSIPLVRGPSELCNQEVAIYALNFTAVPPQRVFSLVNQVNPNIFCIYSINYRPGLSFISPVVPTESNFNDLVKEFSGNSFSTVPSASAGASNPARYEYGAPIQTKGSFLRFPVPFITSQCADNNPAGFLVNQTATCSRSVNVENCNIPALSMSFYASVPILQVPNSNNMINITVQDLYGIFDLNSNGVPNVSQVCRNVVLEVSYLILYSDAGEITNACVSFVLGPINTTTVQIEQKFQIHFIQQNRTPIAVSGNPGYVVGLPLVAGFQSFASGIIRSTNRYGQFTILKSYSNQDCLVIEGNRTPVIFGYNMVSGCKLQYSLNSTCFVVAEAIKNVLMGQNFPEYVASFGNSKPQIVLDWVPITLLNTTTGKAGTAQTVQVLSSVTFIDGSAPAQPGYKAQPTIDAKLPFDFFYPFV